jgi:predicted MPP superfamily phosphohydrolase
MPDTAILRFRDLTGDDPIHAHREIISRAGYVWWGWWKKSSEPDRFKELNELREKAQSSGVLVGLFDRSTNALYAAETIDCVSSSGPIASPQPDATPKYYAHAKIAAWFKLTNIESVDEENFVKLFAAPPVGEGTFFPVWRGSNPSPVISADSISLSRPKILHISDVHLGGDFAFPTVAGPGAVPLIDVIERDLGDDKPGLIVMSGDLTTRADANVLLDDGVRFLTGLADRMGVPRECVVIVPGNHDIGLKNFKPHDYSHEASFHSFVKEFYGRQMPYPGLRRFSLPSGRSLEILTINSVRLRHEKERQFGYIQWPLYDHFLKALPRDPDGFRMAVLHHHLVAATREESIDPNYPEAGVSTTLDAGAVIEGLQSHGFALALHGHQHVPAITRVSRASLPENGELVELGQGLVVLAAGSAGASRLADEMRDNSYNILSFGADGLNIQARRYNKGLKPQVHFRCTI